jgi:hypothetical protein
MEVLKNATKWHNSFSLTKSMKLWMVDDSKKYDILLCACDRTPEVYGVN